MALVHIYPHEIGRDLIPELATRVYSSQLDSFREAISNAFDENSKQVALSIRKDRIVIEDWGNGIKDYDEFRKFGQASKKLRSGGEVIGEKGLGKLSLLNLGNSVCFETNNGRVGIRFHMNMAGFSKPEFGKNKASFVNHKGTRITITDITNRVEEIIGIVAYLKKVFSLRLAQGAKIMINAEHLKPKSTLDPSEMPLFTLSKSIEVTGNLKEDKDGKGVADVYIDHVFVTSLEVDTRRSFSGWVNCNALTPETSRNNIVQNEIYGKFLGYLRKYASRFPFRQVETIDHHKLLVSKELNSLLKSYIKDMKINFVDNKQTGAGRSAQNPANSHNGADGNRGIKSLQTPGSKPFSSISTNLPELKRPMSSGSSIHWQYADLGNEKGPIYFAPPNTVYCNTSNDLFRFAVKKNGHYGPTWLRMLPYLARIAVEINTKTLTLRPDEFNLRVDEATRYFLKQKKALN